MCSGIFLFLMFYFFSGCDYFFLSWQMPNKSQSNNLESTVGVPLLHPSQVFPFLYIEGLWATLFKASLICAIFPMAFTHFLSLSRFSNSCNVSNFFTTIIFVMVICDH